MPFSTSRGSRRRSACSPIRYRDSTDIHRSLGSGIRRRELFYLDADGYLTTVSVQTAGTTFIPGKPTRLFNRRYYAGLSPRGRDLGEYDVASDAQRFLMIKNEGNDDRPASLAGMVVVLNWGEELKRLVPTK